MLLVVHIKYNRLLLTETTEPKQMRCMQWKFPFKAQRYDENKPLQTQNGI